MLKVIALAVALAAITGVAGAQTMGTARTTTAMRRPTAVRQESQAALRREAKISEARARATALREVPNGRIRASQLARQNGKLIYSFNIGVPGRTGSEAIAVHAINGSVVSHEHRR